MSRRYRMQLRDPRWQRRRLEIMSKAQFSCEQCGDTKTTLNVHHKQYRRGAQPWEYSDDELACWCENCHAAEHKTECPKRRTDFQSDSAYVRYVRDWLLRKAKGIGLTSAEKSILSDVQAGMYGRVA
jgi:hypothetical protein